MFNVIVTSEPNAWETDQVMRMFRDRFKSCSGGPEADRISLTNPETLKQLERTQTLLFYENDVKGENADVVRCGLVHDIAFNESYVFFRFVEEARLPRSALRDFATRLGLSKFEINHTHWAIKEGGIPSVVRSKLTPVYDVVFSFAGEDREYVAKVARYLRLKGVRIFYDRFEESTLWGRDLAEHFDTIYAQSGRYCVLFISKHYAEKMWTKHERRTAMDRALKDHEEYILPARFDDTKIPGIRSTLAFVSLTGMRPSELGKRILQKLGRLPS